MIPDFPDVILIILIASPLLLLFGLPWFLAAWAVAAATPGMPQPQRFLILSAICAAGVAPVFGAHTIMPVYLLLFFGGLPGFYAPVSYLATWLVIVLVGAGIAKWRRRGPKDEQGAQARQQM